MRLCLDWNLVSGPRTLLPGHYVLFLLRESAAQMKDIFLLLPKSAEMGQGSLGAPDDPFYRGDVRGVTYTAGMLGHISRKQESAWDLWQSSKPSFSAVPMFLKVRDLTTK